MYTDDSITLPTIARITDTIVEYINGETVSTVWQGWSICLYLDYCVHACSILIETTGLPPVITVINVLKPSVYAYVITLVTIGLILSIVCLMFNVIFRNRK